MVVSSPPPAMVAPPPPTTLPSSGTWAWAAPAARARAKREAKTVRVMVGLLKACAGIVPGLFAWIDPWRFRSVPRRVQSDFARCEPCRGAFRPRAGLIYERVDGRGPPE